MPEKSKMEMELRTELGSLQKNIGFLNEDIGILLKNELWAFQSEQKKINPELVLYTSSIDSVKMKNLIGNGKLVFYFGEYSCQECYQKIISKLNRYIETSHSKNIVVIAHFENFRNFHFFVKNTTIKAPIYYISKKLDLAVENSLQPFLFVLYDSFKTDYVLIPYKKYDKNIESYFDVADHSLN